MRATSRAVPSSRLAHVGSTIARTLWPARSNNVPQLVGGRFAEVDPGADAVADAYAKAGAR